MEQKCPRVRLGAERASRHAVRATHCSGEPILHLSSPIDHCSVDPINSKALGRSLQPLFGIHNLGPVYNRAWQWFTPRLVALAEMFKVSRRRDSLTFTRPALDRAELPDPQKLWMGREKNSATSLRKDAISFWHHLIVSQCGRSVLPPPQMLWRPAAAP